MEPTTTAVPARGGSALGTWTRTRLSELGVGGGRLSVATVDEWTGDLDQLATRLDKAVASTLSARLCVSLATRESR